MRKTPYLICLLLILTTLSGCMVPEPEDGVSFAFIMLAGDASRADEGQDGCGAGSDVECHSVPITGKNSGDIEISTEKSLWEATSNDGANTWSAFSVSGLEIISPGSDVTLTVHFEVANGETLSSIKWSDNVEQIGETSTTSPIKAYD